MKTKFLFAIAVAALMSSCGSQTFAPTADNGLRAPAYPLVTIDPYTSAWSFADNLYDEPVKHWTGKEFPLIGAVRVDGQVYRVMGTESIPLQPLLPTAATEKWDARYTETAPAKGWEALNFNDKSWSKGKAAFGTPEMANLGTEWTGKNIWVRRTFTLSEDLASKTVYLEYSHDDTFELYINGIEVVKTGYEWKDNVLLKLPEDVVATLKAGENIIAAHCENRTGGGLVDFGLFVKEDKGDSFATAAVQKSATVLPTQTYYTFQCGPVDMDLIFTAPLLMDNLYLMSSPVNYITYQVRSNDGKSHDVQVYFDATSNWAVNNPAQEVGYEKLGKNGIAYVKTGTLEQNILGRKGDDVRIDWGYFYLAAAEGKGNVALGDYYTSKQNFADSAALQDVSADQLPSGTAVLAYSNDMGKVSAEPVSGYFMIGYDDIYSIQYFQENLRPYWAKGGSVDIYQEFERANMDYAAIMKKCAAFDRELMAEAIEAGGKEYAELCALAYRQAISAHKLVADNNGELLFLSKENFSNGSIGTVDITYPSAPLFLYYNPELAKGLMNHIFYYSESGKWAKPFAAHDVGTYPLANGQTYGGDMPVEESGNMIILANAIAQVEGNAKYAEKHWDVLTTWTDYLVENGLDPENQLCTDDFAGHFAHNINLSVKAIMGIASYAQMAEMLGKQDVADKYMAIAKEMGAKWKEMAADGDHYRLTFDQPGTWSQKYNMVWDKIFGTGIFDPQIAATEIDYYLTKQNEYGLPLDSRRDYTKSDWIVWTACLTDNPDDFQAFILPVHKYAAETKTRMPLSDWHDTKTGNSVGFRARSVVGGYYMKMLADKLAK